MLILSTFSFCHKVFNSCSLQMASKGVYKWESVYMTFYLIFLFSLQKKFVYQNVGQGRSIMQIWILSIGHITKVRFKLETLINQNHQLIKSFQHTENLQMTTLKTDRQKYGKSLQMMIKISNIVENIVANGEIPHY